MSVGVLCVFCGVVIVIVMCVVQGSENAAYRRWRDAHVAQHAIDWRTLMRLFQEKAPQEWANNLTDVTVQAMKVAGDRFEALTGDLRDIRDRLTQIEQRLGKLERQRGVEKPMRLIELSD